MVTKTKTYEDVDDKTLPLVWSHGHNDMEDVIGHVLLEDRRDGMILTLKKVSNLQELVKKGIVQLQR